MRKYLSILLILIVNVAIAQRTITGCITDKQGNPINEVTISAKNTLLKTFSDTEGKYAIMVPEECRVLKFSKQ